MNGCWPNDCRTAHGRRGSQPVTTAGFGCYRRLAHSRSGLPVEHDRQFALRGPPSRASAERGGATADSICCSARRAREAHVFGFEVSRLLGTEPARGRLSFLRALLIWPWCSILCGHSAIAEDDRVAGLVAFVQGLQGPYGLSEYPPQPQTARWVTYDVLRSLSQLRSDTEWLSLEPRTPFHAYPRTRTR